MRNLQELKALLTNIDERIKNVNNELKTLPKGTARIEKRRGLQVQVYSHYEDGKRVRESIKDNMDMQAQLFKAALLRKELDCLEHNRAKLAEFILQYKPFSYAKCIQENQSDYICGGAELLQIYSKKYDSGAIWAAEDYAQSDYKIEERRHVTSRGLLVRSKSEVLIAEKLYEHQIPFRYEQSIKIGNVTLNPDFTIMRADGKIFYWEHEGLTNSREYLNWQERKTHLYASIGIVPWDNLIVSYDSADGIINLKIVESEIRNKLLL